jgi:hypothetical protein
MIVEGSRQKRLEFLFDVHFGPLADTEAAPRNVRFTPKSRHQ